jgi:fluoride ion exporter CrcB/FEX
VVVPQLVQRHLGDAHPSAQAVEDLERVRTGKGCAGALTAPSTFSFEKCKLTAGE